MSPRLSRISAKKACLSFLIVQLQYPSSTPLISSACNSCSFLDNIYVLYTNVTAYATFCHSEHFLRINLVHSMHFTEFTINPFFQSPHSLRQGSSSFCCLPQASSFHCSFTRVKTLNHFFHRHWRLRQYLSYTCSCN